MNPQPIRAGDVVCPECKGLVVSFEKMTPGDLVSLPVMREPVGR